MTERIQDIYDELVTSKKYRHLSDETILRTAQWASMRYRSSKDAAKAARRKLHQVFAAYGSHHSMDRLAERVSNLPDPASEDFRAACLQLLRDHASTAERISLMDELYPALWSEIGSPGVLVDLACGYHTFALPWMGLGETAVYHGCDIDKRVVAASNDFLTRLGKPTNIVCKDVLAGTMPIHADVVFLFKSLPCLEQQDPGIGPAVLRQLHARHAVVSFPLESLGGRSKGMASTYERYMERTVAELNVPVRKLSFPNEVFYILTLAPSSQAERTGAV
jgi:16S rRNA (guanine(1405)-N(7))-methyltransferase